MRLIVSGTRLQLTEAGMWYVEHVFSDLVDEVCYSEVGVGDASGVDARIRSYWGNPEVFRADWQGLGRKAGPIRNRAMVEWAAEEQGSWLLSLPFPQSMRGTLDCTTQAIQAGLTVLVRPLRPEHVIVP